MTLRRHHRRLIVFFALFSLLFMHLAVASYVCPATFASATEASMVTVDGMPCGEMASMGMDEAQPSLCHAHCHADKQSSDKYELPTPVAAKAMPANFRLVVAVTDFPGVVLQAPHLKRATAPPVAVRNCCFRI